MKLPPLFAAWRQTLRSGYGVPALRGDITAGLDVFHPEPIPADSEILQLPNVFLSPHFAGLTGDAYPHFFRLMVDELERFFHGHETRFDLTPRSLANRRGDEPTRQKSG